MNTFRLLLATLILFLTLPNAIHANGIGSIRGKIVDQETGKPIYMAAVAVTFGSDVIGTTTDIEGRFHLKPIPTGTYALKVQMVGYPKFELSNVHVSSNKVTMLGEIPLTAGININTFVKLEHITPLINPEDPMAIPLRWDDIEKSPALRNPEGLIASMGQGVYQKDEGQPIHFRGARDDASYYFVDGIKVKGPGFGIPSQAIGEITIYTGGIPAQYGDVTGGIVVVETKSYFDLYNRYTNNHN